MDITAATAAVPSKATESSATLAGDFDTFLTLLTSQLQNQDPMDPMQSNEFTNQIVSFAGVEQQIQQNQNLEKMTSLLQQANISNVANYLGQTAVIESNQILTDGSGGTWEYDLPMAADTVKIQVLDADDNVIYEGFGDGLFGTNKFMWNGQNSFTGNNVPPGTYKLNVEAQATADDGTDVPVFATVFAYATIDELRVEGTDPVFKVGGHDVTQSGILRLIRSGMGISDATTSEQDGTNSDPLLDLV